MLNLEADSPESYLGFSAVIDGEDAEVAAFHAQLVAEAGTSDEQARRIFTFVRDQIRHSEDAGDHAVTLRASEVLSKGTGLCYAKSHLAVALLRRSGIPAGLCYQRLRNGEGFALHGLLAVHLEGAWHRLDVRGEKPGVHAKFSLTEEILPFRPDPTVGEEDLAALLVDPAPAVVRCLSSGTDALRLRLPEALT
jgi:transglutaminase-like putative cysteine protease